MYERDSKTHSGLRDSKGFCKPFFFWSNKIKFNREKFYSEYRKHFGALQVGQVQGLNFLLDAIEKTPVWNDLRHIAYLLSTVKHETAHTFKPITEYGEDSYFRKYEGRSDLGNNRPGDGLKFKGRGFSQITGRRNYTKFSQLLNTDLVNNPKAVLEPNIAFRIITLGMHRGYFTGKKLTDFINDTVCDYKNARRIINGLDKASTLAGYAQRFYQILRAAKVSTPSVATTASSQPVIAGVVPDFSNLSDANIESALRPIEAVPTNHTESIPNAGAGDDVNAAPVPSMAEGGQVAENITNVNQGNTVPENFVPENLPVTAPPKENTTTNATQLTIWGILVPPGLVGVVTAIKSAFEQGFIDSKAVFDAVLNLLLNNLRYVPYLIGLIIGILIIKKVFKQLSFMLTVWLTARSDTNNPVIIPSVKEEPKPTGFFGRLKYLISGT